MGGERGRGKVGRRKKGEGREEKGNREEWEKKVSRREAWGGGALGRWKRSENAKEERNG